MKSRSQDRILEKLENGETETAELLRVEALLRAVVEKLNQLGWLRGRAAPAGETGAGK